MTDGCSEAYRERRENERASQRTESEKRKVSEPAPEQVNAKVARLDARVIELTDKLVFVHKSLEDVLKQLRQFCNAPTAPPASAPPASAPPASAPPASAPLEEVELDPFEEELAIKAEMEVERLNGLDAEPPTDEATDDPTDGLVDVTTLMNRLIKEGTLQIDFDATRRRQYVAVGPHGQRNDIFANKEVFKRMTNRFYFESEFKRWERFLPDSR